MEMTHDFSEKAMEDYKIVLQALSGSEKAYKELFEKYKSSVFFMILKMVNDRIEAEGLMCETFEKAFANLRDYSPQFAFSTWLFKIASNNTIDFIRKQKAKTVSLNFNDVSKDERGYIETLASDIRTPEEEIVHGERAALMREAVSLLKGRYRELVELRYFEEYSYEEIAEQLNLPLGTVKAQLFRAREMLLNLLGNKDMYPNG